MIVGPGQTQAAVLNWQAAFPTRVPMQGLTLPPDTDGADGERRVRPRRAGRGRDLPRAREGDADGPDDRPGVSVEYRINGGPWTAYTAPGHDRSRRRLHRRVARAGRRGQPVRGRLAAAPDRQARPRSDGDIEGSVPPTLSLELGAPGSFGTFQPGVTRDYTATTTATVTSTAGDATLSVADPARRTGRLVNGSYTLEQRCRPAPGLARSRRSAAQRARRRCSRTTRRSPGASSASSSSSRSVRPRGSARAPMARR